MVVVHLKNVAYSFRKNVHYCFFIFSLFNYLFKNQLDQFIMALTVVFQLAALLLVVAAGPLVVILLSVRGGNL